MGERKKFNACRYGVTGLVKVPAFVFPPLRYTFRNAICKGQSIDRWGCEAFAVFDHKVNASSIVKVIIAKVKDHFFKTILTESINILHFKHGTVCTVGHIIFFQIGG